MSATESARRDDLLATLSWSAVQEDAKPAQWLVIAAQPVLSPVVYEGDWTAILECVRDHHAAFAQEVLQACGSAVIDNAGDSVVMAVCPPEAAPAISMAGWDLVQRAAEGKWASKVAITCDWLTDIAPYGSGSPEGIVDLRGPAVDAAMRLLKDVAGIGQVIMSGAVVDLYDPGERSDLVPLPVPPTEKRVLPIRQRMGVAQLLPKEERARVVHRPELRRHLQRLEDATRELLSRVEQHISEIHASAEDDPGPRKFKKHRMDFEYMGDGDASPIELIQKACRAGNDEFELHPDLGVLVEQMLGMHASIVKQLEHLGSSSVDESSSKRRTKLDQVHGSLTEMKRAPERVITHIGKLRRRYEEYMEPVDGR